MNLKTFVSESLLQSAAGIKEAQERAQETGAIISPQVYKEVNGTGVYLSNKESAHPLCHQINFDVAVTAESGINGKAGASLSVLGLSLLDTNVSGHDKSATVSRIQLNVDVLWPQQIQAPAEYKKIE